MQQSSFGFRTPRLMKGIKWILIINVAVFILQHVFLAAIALDETGQITAATIFEKWFALYPVESDHFQVWQFITFQFLHGGPLHIFFNMLVTWMIGTALEQVWGTRHFVVYYLLCGIAAGVGQITVSSFAGELIPLVGASGGVFGIIVGFGLTYPNERLLLFPFFVPVRAYILMWILLGMQLVLGLLNSGSNVSHVGHLGGAAMGFFLIRQGARFGVFRFFDSAIDTVRDMFKGNKTMKRPPQQDSDQGANVFSIHDNTPPKESTPSWFRTQTRRSEPENQEITAEEIDAILDKVNEEGYNNLSDREKRILEEYSKKL